MALDHSHLAPIVQPRRLWSRDEVLATPSPVPRRPGVYGWYFKDLPPDFDSQSAIVAHGCTLLYVGIAPSRPGSKTTLQSRIRLHFCATADESTLRRSLGCLLASRLGLELCQVGGGRRTTFGAGEARLSDWMADHALVCWLEHSEPWLLERQFLQQLLLLLNLQGNVRNPLHEQLTRLRRQAQDRARASTDRRATAGHDPAIVCGTTVHHDGS